MKNCDEYGNLVAFFTLKSFHCAPPCVFPLWYVELLLDVLAVAGGLAVCVCVFVYSCSSFRFVLFQ